MPVILLLENILCRHLQKCEVGLDLTWKANEAVLLKWLYIFIFECLKFMQLFKKL